MWALQNPITSLSRSDKPIHQSQYKDPLFTVTNAQKHHHENNIPMTAIINYTLTACQDFPSVFYYVAMWLLGCWGGLLWHSWEVVRWLLLVSTFGLGPWFNIVYMIKYCFYQIKVQSLGKVIADLFSRTLEISLSSLTTYIYIRFCSNP